MIELSTRQCKCGRGLIPKNWRCCTACWEEASARRKAVHAAKAAAYQATYRKEKACRVCGTSMVLSYSQRFVRTCSACLAAKSKPLVRDCVYCGTAMPERSYNAKFCGPCEIARHPWKAAAGVAVANALRLGDLPPASSFVCEDCGAQAEHWDHRDYSKPLEVAPVCRRCNILRGPAEFPRPQPNEAAA